MRNGRMLPACGALLLAGLMSCVDPVELEVSSTPSPRVSGQRLGGVSDVELRVLDLLPGDLGSRPSGSVVLNGKFFFTASDDATGHEPWTSDGTAAGTVQLKDLVPGTGNSFATGFTLVQDTVFFAANSALWKSDGTPAGTALVRSELLAYALVGMNGVLYLSAYDRQTGEAELWRSDGTAPGTHVVKNIATSSSVRPNSLTVVGNTLFFTIDDGVTGEELWKSDGTAAGTTRVKDLNPGLTGSTPSNLLQVNGTLFFTANDGTHGQELWRSDGTEEGTVLVKDLVAGPSQGSQLEFLTNVNGTLFFMLDKDSAGYELWKTDGSADGTVKVTNLPRFMYFASPAVMGGALYFAQFSTGGMELWKSDGTAAGTVLVHTLTGVGPYGPQPGLTVVDGTLYYAFHTPTAGQLWKTDGTPAGTVLVTTFPVGREHPSFWPLAGMGGTLILYANDGAHGHELWKSDGTAEGTVLVRDIQTRGASSAPKFLTDVGGTLFLVADERVDLAQLWKSDGTQAGTRPIKRMAGAAPDALTAVGRTLFFAASEPTIGRELWKSDGTEAGTVLVKDLRPNSTSDSSPQALKNVGGTLYFSAHDGSTGQELWKSDGTPAGTVLVKDIYPGLFGAWPLPTDLRRADGAMLFAAVSGVGDELWASDGTAVGTVLVKDIRAGGSSSSPTSLTQWNGTLFFQAEGDLTGIELWKSDGTEAGTVLVKDIRPGSFHGLGSSTPMAALGGLLYFPANDGTTGLELWRTDGTAAGTVRLRDIRVGSGASSPDSLIHWGGALYFTADDGFSGRELWKSDGTAAGTVRLKDIRPGATGSSPTSFVPFDGALYFVANDGVNGRELWRTDGTEAGTVQVVDLWPGAASSSPEQLTVSGDRLYFVADDYTHGRELWVLSRRGPDTAPPRVTCPTPVTAEATGASGAKVTYPAATATDDVTAAPSMSYDFPSDSLFPLGETTVTATATDEAGNSAACQFTVTVRDATAPALTCPEDVLAEATGASGATVSYVLPTATDAVTASPQVTASHASGSTFAAGSTPVTLSAKDDVGNSATCQFTVTVRDTTAPRMSCPVDLDVEATSASGATVDYVLPTAVDVVTASPRVTSSHAPGSTFALGFTPVTLTAMDAAGNEASCRFTVTVKDTTAPTLTCPVDVTAEATGASGATVTYPAASASDAVSSVSLAYSHASGTDFPLAETTVTVTATDGAGNAASCQFKVTVRDTTRPQVTCPADLLVEATSGQGAVVDYPQATVSDAVSTPAVSYSHPAKTLFAQGETTVTVTATDTAGNASSCQFKVTVKDSTAPQVTCPVDTVAEATSELGSVVEFPLASASDAVSSARISYSHESGALFALGATAVTVTATDEASNTASCRFTVTVRDTTPPDVGCAPDFVVEAEDASGADVAYLLARPRDNVTRDPVVSVTHGPGSRFPLGTTEVSLTATDAAGNVASCRFTVTVRDTTAPQVACPADLVAEAQDAAGSLVPFTLAPAQDAVTATPTVELTHASGSRFPFGTTEVFLTAADAAGNAASCRFTVTVADTTAPQVTCPADVAVETLDSEGAAVTYASASASDGISPVTVDYSAPSGGLFAPGSTPVSVTATDAAGNVAMCDFQVSVSVRKPVSVPVFAGGCSSAGGPLSFAWSVLVLLGWQVARRRSRSTR